LNHRVIAIPQAPRHQAVATELSNHHGSSQSKVALSTGTRQDERRDEEPVILQLPTVSRAERLARLRARLSKVDVEAIRQRTTVAK
jgi:hypothetical protein